MKPFDIGELVFLAALWGASFLFMRLGAHEFGPVALAAVRVGLASAMLIPLLAARGPRSSRARGSPRPAILAHGWSVAAD